MRDEFIGENGGIGFDFDDVDGDGGDFGEEGAAEGVGESEVDGAEAEVNTMWFSLLVCGFIFVRMDLLFGLFFSSIYLSDCDLRPLGLNVHFIIVHDGWESRRAKAGFLLPCGMVLERRLLRIHERGDGSAQVVKSTKPYRKDGLAESFFGVGEKMSGVGAVGAGEALSKIPD